jgi:hypothetical protein
LEVGALEERWMEEVELVAEAKGGERERASERASQRASER